MRASALGLEARSRSCYLRRAHPAPWTRADWAPVQSAVVDRPDDVDGLEKAAVALATPHEGERRASARPPFCPAAPGLAVDRFSSGLDRGRLRALRSARDVLDTWPGGFADAGRRVGLSLVQRLRPQERDGETIELLAVL